MSDSKLRELERRWRETGSVDDEAAYLREFGRLLPEHFCAVLSDAQGNLPALRAVFEDLGACGNPRVVFLGDGVGRAPYPVECLAALRERACFYGRGRWEAALFGHERPQFGSAEATTLEWLRNQLRHTDASTRGLWEWLSVRPTDFSLNQWYFRHHGIPGALESTVFFDDAQRPAVLEALFSQAGTARTILIGANQESWLCSPSRSAAFRARELGDRYTRSAEELIVVSAGSVGATKDGDPRAVYCVLAGPHVLWRRVRYDHEAVAREIVKVPGVPPSWGIRMAKGI